MKIIELVNYFRKKGDYQNFCDKESLDVESGVVEIYMKKPFDLENELMFFEIEKTKGNIEFLFNDVKYYNLFDFYYFLDVIEELKGIDSVISDNDIAVKLLNYAINDA
ncbi:hypothetical protein [Aureivirga sp. CE67]|uniref:hypothetical protein n=1 Tax=Aureivirga sp. CE67 TaxID=1788983 RepID=UPI0018CAD4D7|nr:hypothetical protein [Aureivirga sp. CE67]